MKITVERYVKDEQLIFTITCSEPHQVPFGEVEKQMMYLLEKCQSDIEETSAEQNALKHDVKGLIHAAKEKTFNRVQKSLRFDIENSLEDKFQPMVEEVYNWIYDHQKDAVKQWLAEFNPSRNTYYFDNDAKASNRFNDDSDYDYDNIEVEDEEE